MSFEITFAEQNAGHSLKTFFRMCIIKQTHVHNHCSKNPFQNKNVLHYWNALNDSRFKYFDLKILAKQLTSKDSHEMNPNVSESASLYTGIVMPF